MSKIRLHGSSSGYVEIAPAAAASNNTLTAPSTVGEIIAKDAAGAIGITSMKASNVNVGAAVTITESGIEASGIGITCANINGGAISGRKNKIINGDFTIHQRGGTITASSALYTLDRWRSYITGDSPGGFTVQQSTGSYPQTSISGVKDNFKASVLITVTSAGSAAANNNVKFQQRIEGSDVYDLALGTAAAKSFTVSFYVKSSLTGTFGASLVNSAHNRSNIQTYTVNSANTWEYKTFTVAGDTSGTWVTNTGTGLQLMFDLGSGSDKLTDTTNQWVAGEYHGTTSSVKLTHTNSATLQFAGVQLEAGTQATAFEHRSFAEELSLCQRYCQVLGGNTSQELFMYATGNGTGTATGFYQAPVDFRTTPSFSISNLSHVNIYNFTNSGNLGSPSSMNLITAMSAKHWIYIDSPVNNTTSGGGIMVRANSTTDARFILTAEL